MLLLVLRQTLWREKGTRYEVEENDVLEVEGVIENGVMRETEDIVLERNLNFCQI